VALPISITGGTIATEGGVFAGRTGEFSTLASNSTGGIIDAFAEKASDVFEKRTATRIFDSHQDIALKSIEGGQFPRFDENQNLYGFTLFQFKRGFFGGGWAPLNVNSLLGSDLNSLASGMLGGDQVANVQSYFFNMHPKSMNVSEPFATHIVPTQGGGMYVESQGVLLRQMTLTGTTGYRPAMTHVVTQNPDNVIPHTLNEPTGYLNFLKLRNLFRNYSDLKRTKSLSYKTYMIFYNNKEQEAWFFEPDTFTTNRDSSSPFTYDYNISGKLIQKVNFSTIVSKLSSDPTSVHFQVASMRRGAALLNGIIGRAVPAVGDDAIGETLNLVSKYLSYLNDVDDFVMSTTELLSGVMGLGPAAVSAVVGAAWEAKNSLNSIFGISEGSQSRYEKIFGKSADYTTAFSQYVKTMLYADHLINDTAKAVMKIFSPQGVEEMNALSVGAGRAANGVRGITNQPKGGVSSNSSYLNDSEHMMVPATIPDGEIDPEGFVADLTGDSSPELFEFTMMYNDLQYPYISQTPTYQTGFNKFLTAGDILYVPVPIEHTEGDINTMINPAKAVSSTYEEVLGRDLLLIKSTMGTTGVSEFNLSISPHGDLDIIGGKDNMKQAIDIKLNTERGELRLHPGFGMIPVIGRKGTNNLTFNLYLSLNDTMLSDGRIKELTDTFVNISGDTVSVKTNVHIIGHVPYIPLVLTMS